MKEYRPNNVVSLSLARTLKNAGFVTYEWVGIYKGGDYYHPESELVINSDNYSLADDEYLAPKEELVYDWIREKLGVEVVLEWEYLDHGITDKVRTKEQLYINYVNDYNKSSERINIHETVTIINDISELGKIMDILLITAIRSQLSLSSEEL